MLDKEWWFGTPSSQLTQSISKILEGAGGVLDKIQDHELVSEGLKSEIYQRKAIL